LFSGGVSEIEEKSNVIDWDRLEVLLNSIDGGDTSNM
jgi:hypothetical protein